MTVTAAEARIEYAGNGTTLVFAYPYKFFQNDDLDVWLFDDTTDIGVEQVLGADYTVTGALNPSGGNVTMVVPPPGGHTLIIINSPDIVQTTHYVNADDFPADSHEQGLDRLTKICQRLSDRIDRAVRAPDYAPEDQVPDAATLVGLVEDAQEAADDSAASAADSASEASASQAAASQASDYASAAAGSAGLAAGSASNAASSAAQAASSAAQAEVNEVNWIGPWSASYQYKDNDAVSFAGSSWIALRSNINMQPDTHPADWDLLAAQGGAGPAGSGGGDMLRANNLSDLTAPTTARTNLGLGNSATLNVGTTPSTVAAGNDPRFGVIVSATAPAGAPPGTLWWESDSGLLYFRYDDGTSVQWVIACPQPSIDGFLLRTGDTMTGPLVLPGDPTTNLQAATKAYVDANTGASLLISDTPPVGAKDGSLWWESDTGTLYVRYNDGNTVQWVIAAPQPDINAFALKTDIAAQAVRYDTAQSLTAPQQQQARQNIYAAPFDAMAYSGLQINGGMEVSQERGTTATSTNASYVCDGWKFYFSGTMGVSAATGASPLFPGFPYNLFVTVLTAQASLGAGDYVQIIQPIEGWRIAGLGWGTAQAQPITIGFWTAHNRVGLYSGTITNVNSRSYAFTYTQVVAAAPQYNTITIPGDTAGTWATDNTIGMNIHFTMASGATGTAPSANNWLAGNYAAAPGQINGVAATSDAFRITGVTVLPGTEAPSAARSPFVMRSYQDELLICKRYFYNGVPPLIGVASSASTIGRASCRHPVSMRAAPTLTVTSALTFFDGTGVMTVSAVGTNYSSVDAIQFDVASMAGPTATYRPVIVLPPSGGNLNVDARL